MGRAFPHGTGVPPNLTAAPEGRRGWEPAQLWTAAQSVWTKNDAGQAIFFRLSRGQILSKWDRGKTQTFQSTFPLEVLLLNPIKRIHCFLIPILILNFIDTHEYAL